MGFQSLVMEKGASMKLQMLFVLMDLLTLVTIPFMFLFGELRQFRKGLSWVATEKLYNSKILLTFGDDK